MVEAAEVANDTDREPDREAAAAYERLIQQLLELTAGPVITLDFEAHEHRERVNEIADAVKILPTSSEALRQHMGKWRGRYARLLLVFHAIECAARGEGLGVMVSGETAHSRGEYVIFTPSPPWQNPLSPNTLRARVQ